MAVVAAAGGHRGVRGIARACHQSGWIFARGVWLLCRDGAGRGDGRGKMGDGDVGLKLWLACCDFQRRPQQEGGRPKSGTAAQSRHRVPALSLLFSSSPTTANTTADQSSRPPKQTGIPTILSLVVPSWCASSHPVSQSWSDGCSGSNQLRPQASPSPSSAYADAGKCGHAERLLDALQHPVGTEDAVDSSSALMAWVGMPRRPFCRSLLHGPWLVPPRRLPCAAHGEPEQTPARGHLTNPG